ncbi:MAG: MBL fold metallo-hydrolase [Synechococcales cyanobacterium]
MPRCTWLDANSWLWEWGSLRILVDPWLVGDLLFADLPWLFRGSREREVPIPTDLSAILLSQGLPDHAHLPTLRRLVERDPQQFLIASPAGAKVARQIGFTQVIALAPGQTFTLDSLVIAALPGAPIGPIQRENAYILRHPQGSLYYEPHGFPSPELQQQEAVDVVISPIQDMTLPVLGAIIQGQASILPLAHHLKPHLILPTAMAAEVRYQGVLAQWLRFSGSAEQLRQDLAQAQLSTQVGDPRVGEPIEFGSPVAAS